MLGWAVLCLLALHFYGVASQGECTDLRGRLISHGLHYVPGPDTCTLCVCDNGLPKVCKAVLCSPPQDCRSFRVGNTCCEFICLDDVVKPAEGAEANVRVAAGGAATVVLLTVALVVYRVRKQKRRRPPHADDQRSLTSIGYISGSMGYMGGTCETALAGWKPPGNYLPRGEAPPPYDEVVAQCRNENMRMQSEQAFHRTYPATVESLARPEDSMQCSGHSYTNVPRPMAQMPNPQNCYNAPLLQPVHPPEPRDSNSMIHHPLAPNMVGFPHAVRLTGSLGAISNRGLLTLLQREPTPERPHNVPGFYANAAVMHASHRTIPRISTAVDTTMLESGLGGFNRCGERGLGLGEIRRSFHRPGEPRAPPGDTGRSMPRNLNLASVGPELTDLPHLRSRDPASLDSINMRLSSSGGGCNGTAVNGERREEAGADKTVKPPPPDATHQTLPLTVDKPSCVCSYSGAGADAQSGEHGEEADDYRSECENCKAASSSSVRQMGAGRGLGRRGGGRHADAAASRPRRARAASARHQHAAAARHQAAPDYHGPTFELGELVQYNSRFGHRIRGGVT
ncbi:uncharacterized protein LOC113234792 isoform X2 [Hyposmocoma kahamanoa]|uniref:uncharacterized protein LOC113234792 isoform X2 n=1 Tax=Hyposmocoma kahamanoa TaxID=1477025 RepID=UPI000E6D5D4E|nr:uncharacterized protein LOC113234792 isoform X2 [Hyposmocoma kahamanoa]